MQLSSPAFADGQPIPRRYTCDGENVSPPLSWAGAPANARSFVLLCNDPDAPAGVWRHWAVYDIADAEAHLPEGLPARQFRQAINDFGKRGYGGPCPPRGHGLHHYRFIVLALDADTLGLGENVRCVDVERAARAHATAEAELTGTYQR